MGADLCVVCRRRQPERGHVCEPDRTRIAGQLAELPRMVRALTLQLVPVSAAAGPKVAATRTGSPTGARLDALTLLGPGSDGLSEAAAAAMVSPAVRRWRTVTTVTVQLDTPTGPAARDVEVVTWHRQPVLDNAGNPVMVVADDQVGILPPAEWLDSWARDWRRHFGVHPAPQPRPRATPVANGPAARRQAIEVVLGLGRGHAGAPTLHPLDPLAAEWEARWGEPEPTGRVLADVHTLQVWLDYACDADVGIAAFAAELRTLTAELTRVLGEVPAQQWLGRCPTTLTDRATATSRPCGAALWQDPHAAQVVCPRCHSTWGPGKMALLHLARAIRRVWPVDRRRRYTYDEIKGLRRLRCPTCREPVDITWRDATALGEQQRTWRPDRALCPAGCSSARELI